MYLLPQCYQEQELNQGHTFFCQSHLWTNQMAKLSSWKTIQKNIVPDDEQCETSILFLTRSISMHHKELLFALISIAKNVSFVYLFISTSTLP